MVRRGVWWFCFALVMLVGLSPAWAEPSPQASQAKSGAIEKARELFRKGVSFTQAGRWRDAVVAFTQSAAANPHGATLYNLGFCERALGNFTRARKQFLKALDRNALSAGRELTPKQLTDTHRFLQEVDETIAKLAITLTSAEVEIAIDGRPLEVLEREEQPPVLVANTRNRGAGEPPPTGSFELWIDPGEHVIILSRNGKGRQVIYEAFETSERRSLRWEYVPEAAESPTEPASPRVRRSPSRRGWAVGFGVAGLGLATVGGVLVGLAAADWSDAQDACPDSTRCPDGRGSELSDSAQLKGDLATSAFVMAGAALGGAALLWLTAGDPEAPVRLEPALSDEGAAAVVRVRF